MSSTERMAGIHRSITLEKPIASLIESLSAAEIITRRLECERLEIIPLDQINIEDAIIDPSHAEELGKSMKQRRGQITPIAVRARINERSEVVYDIIDGFHRAAGKKRMGEAEIYATVIYGCSDQELFDLRILAASSVRSVQFPRLVEWITKSWETTTWSKGGLNVTQAFGMAISDAHRSNIVSLNSSEVVEIKEWVYDKAKRWGRTIGSTYQMLRLAFFADPELVRRVRTQGGSVKDRMGQITPARLEMVVEEFPGKQNYCVQKALMRVSIEKRCSTKELSSLIARIKNFIKLGMSENEIYALAIDIPLEPLIKKEDSVEETMKPDVLEDEDDDDQDWDMIEPSDKELQKIEKGEADESEDPASDYIRREVAGDLTEPAAFGRGNMGDYASLRKRILDLEEALKEAKENRTASPELWWQTAVYLTHEERTLMENVMYLNQNLDFVASRLKITPLQALTLIRSAFTKRTLSEPQKASWS